MVVRLKLVEAAVLVGLELELVYPYLLLAVMVTAITQLPLVVVALEERLALAKFLHNRAIHQFFRLLLLLVVVGVVKAQQETLGVRADQEVVAEVGHRLALVGLEIHPPLLLHQIPTLRKETREEAV